MSLLGLLAILERSRTRSPDKILTSVSASIGLPIPDVNIRNMSGERLTSRLTIPVRFLEQGGWNATHTRNGVRTGAARRRWRANPERAAERRTSDDQGEIVDLWCYREGGYRGPAKKDCATACARAGNAIGVLDAKGNLYLAAACWWTR